MNPDFDDIKEKITRNSIDYESKKDLSYTVFKEYIEEHNLYKHFREKKIINNFQKRWINIKKLP